MAGATEKVTNEELDAIEPDSTPGRDVLAGGRPMWATPLRGGWVLLPIAFKFGGVPYVSLDAASARLCSDAEMASLPAFDVAAYCDSMEWQWGECPWASD